MLLYIIRGQPVDQQTASEGLCFPRLRAIYRGSQEAILVFQGCRSKAPQTERLQQQYFLTFLETSSSRARWFLFSRGLSPRLTDGRPLPVSSLGPSSRGSCVRIHSSHEDPLHIALRRTRRHLTFLTSLHPVSRYGHIGGTRDCNMWISRGRNSARAHDTSLRPDRCPRWVAEAWWQRGERRHPPVRRLLGSEAEARPGAAHSGSRTEAAKYGVLGKEAHSLQEGLAPRLGGGLLLSVLPPAPNKCGELRPATCLPCAPRAGFSRSTPVQRCSRGHCKGLLSDGWPFAQIFKKTDSYVLMK